jgi:hypothetical protein
VTIANPQIPASREAFIDPRTGMVSRSWYLFLQNLITLVDPNVVPSADDLAVDQAFDSDNTSQVSEIQKEIELLRGREGEDIWAVTGTVRYVNATAPTGVLTVGGVPYQNNGTVTFTWGGTSGGVPYFSGASSMASSAALVDNGVVIGGGAGNAPETISVGTNNQFLAGNTGAAPAFRAAVLASADFVNQGTTTTVLHGNAAGNPSWGAVVLTTDVSGILPVPNGGTGIASGTSGGVLYFSGTTTIASSAVLASQAIVLGGGAGGAPTGLALGTARQVLEVNSGATAPQWTSWPQFKQTVDAGLTLTLDSGYSMVIAGPLTNNGTLTVNGRMQVL